MSAYIYRRETKKHQLWEAATEAERSKNSQERDACCIVDGLLLAQSMSPPRLLLLTSPAAAAAARHYLRKDTERMRKDKGECQDLSSMRYFPKMVHWRREVEQTKRVKPKEVKGLFW